VIAQRFAAAPTLDPTGTSWLPLPFWINGGAMKLFGSSLESARVLAVVCAALAGALVAAVAVAAGLRVRRAIAASIVAAAMPWAMQLAVATVPEIPASACAAAGAIALAAASPNVRLVGALAMLASTLSRYDAWPIAIAFAIVTLLDAYRARGRDRATLIVAAMIAALGPCAWSAWQWAKYGDPLRYLRLVRSYRKALGAGPSLIERLIGYPYGVVEELREAWITGILGASCALFLERRRALDRLDLAWRRPLLLALLQLVVLIAGDVRDGAPTHHPERALLGPATIVIFAAADSVSAVFTELRSFGRKIALAAITTLALTGWIALRLHRTLGWYESAPRPREVAAGRALAALPHGARVLLDTRDFPGGGIDYGYYAVLASFGRPIDAVIDRDQDPRRPRGRSAFDDPERLRDRLREARASAALVWGDDRARTAELLGARIHAEEPPSGAEPRWRVITLPNVP
jgi:4-amino-4-deoxy-L-arabinose transferase-like glycosyltransferase